MKRGKDKAGIIFRKEGGRPVPDGTEVDVTRRARRSLPQQRTYWKALHIVAENDDRWATAEHLHEALKRDLGYITLAYTLTGLPYLATDSTGFDAMTQDEFRVYFDKAMARLAEEVGYDPLAFLSAAA